MRRFNFKASASLNKQTGSTLVITLFILLLVAIVSVVAVRRSTTDLALSTASQVDKLTFQASDSALSKFEQEGRRADSNIGRIDNVMGFLLLTDEEPIGREVTFCLKQSNNRFFNLAKVTERNKSDGYINSRSNGFCNPETDGYTSNRKVMMTQMTLTEEKSNASVEKLLFEYDKTSIPGRKQDGKEGEIRPKYIQVNVSSLIPAYNVTTSLSDISTCMQKRSKLVSSPIVSAPTVTVKDCLDAKSVVNNNQSQDYYYRPQGLNVINN